MVQWLRLYALNTGGPGSLLGQAAGSHMAQLRPSCSVAQSCLTLCNPIDCSTPGIPVLHYVPELAQTCVSEVPGSSAGPGLQMRNKDLKSREIERSHHLYFL